LREIVFEISPPSSQKHLKKTIWIGPSPHQIFSKKHIIVIKRNCDDFEPWDSVSSHCKHFENPSQGISPFFKSLSWLTLKPMAQNYQIVSISFYQNISLEISSAVVHNRGNWTHKGALTH